MRCALPISRAGGARSGVFFAAWALPLLLCLALVFWRSGPHCAALAAEAGNAMDTGSAEAGSVGLENALAGSRGTGNDAVLTGLAVSAEDNTEAGDGEELDDATALFAAKVRQVALWLEMERLAVAGEAENSLDPAWRPLLQRLAAAGQTPEKLLALFMELGPDSYTPAYMAAKITELYGVGGIGINRDKAPGPKEPRNYQPPVPDATAGSCLTFMRDNDQLFKDIKARFGVERDVLVALVLVETAFGQNLGQDRALRVLASMAATDSVEMLASRGNQGQAARIARQKLQDTLAKRSRWAFVELLNLLDFGALMGDAGSLPSSSMGAIGLCQFMPSNIPLFGVDGDQDGVINLFLPTDALYSAANYLEAHGWRQGISEEQKRRVLMAYNHDSIYASYVAATARLVNRALQGKVPPGRMLLAASIVPSARLDPSLRRLKPVPRRARVQSLGDYKSLLQ